MDIPGNLIDDHLNGELSDDGFVELGDWLRERDSHMREFAVQWLIHSSLYDLLSHWSFQAEALFRAVTSNEGMPIVTPFGSTNGSQSISDSTAIDIGGLESGKRRWSKSRDWSRRHALVGLATLLIVGTAVGVWAYFATQPRNVAVLTQTADSQWDNPDGKLFDGALLKAGDVLRLKKGRALVTFFSGARTVLDGPAILAIDSEMAANLTKGAATTNVPTQAVGFTINMPQGRIVDLGTTFTLRIRSNDTFEVQVFEGLVELHMLVQQNHVDESPLRIAKGMAVEVEANLRDVKSIPYDAGQKMTMP